MSTSHANCSHPKTKAARTACRKAQAQQAVAAEKSRLKPLCEIENRPWNFHDYYEWLPNQEGSFYAECQYCANYTITSMIRETNENVCGSCVHDYRKQGVTMTPMHHWTGEELQLMNHDYAIENDLMKHPGM